MIKAFLFDYGGVMSNGGRVGLSGKLSERLNLGADEAYALLSTVWDRYIRNKITEDRLWEILEEQSGQTIPADKRDIWNSWDAMEPLPEMLQLVNDLKEKGYPVGLLSNVIPNTAVELREHGGYDSFDFTILSNEVGCAKPDIEIYHLALGKLPGIKPDEVVFIDDQERCLVPARELGMRTILAENSKQIASDIANLIAAAEPANTR